MKNDVPIQVINKLFDEGYEEQILDIMMSCQDNNKEMSDIPISPDLINDNGDKIIINESVFQIYKSIISRISNETTAQEIPFFLLGNRRIIDGESCIIIDKIILDMENALSETHVSTNVENFTNLIKSSDYDVISIGHTHGNVSEEMKNNTLARTLPDDIKEKYQIRDTGLNISIADIWQHEAFKQIASQNGNKEILQTIIMYNGDIISMGGTNIGKSNNIQTILSNGEIITINTGNLSYPKIGKTI